MLLTPLFMVQADATIVNVAGPSIHAHLRASGSELELVVGGYLLAFAMLLITGARLGQLLGYRRMFLARLLTFTLASLACGLAPSPLVLVAARIAQGCGAALMVPQVLSGVAASLPMLAAFVAVERRAAWPLVNLHVIRRPPIAWGLLPQAVAVSTYYALLFTLALYLQQGLGRSALVSGLTLVAWVAAFGVPRRLLGRVPERLRPIVPGLGCAIGVATFSTAYLSMSADPTHAFATVAAAFAVTALLAGAMAWAGDPLGVERGQALGL